MPKTPFDSLETAQQYIALLREAVEEAQSDVRRDIEAASARHLQALRLVDQKLIHLGVQLRTSSRILNDLRMLRRVLLGADDEE